jgi:hypothetical protein
MRGKRTSGCLPGSPRLLSETKKVYSLPENERVYLNHRIVAQTNTRTGNNNCGPDQNQQSARFFSKRTRMATLALGFVAELHAGATVHNARFFDDQSIVVQFLNVTTTVRERNFVDFVRVEPNLALAALEHVSRQPLLQFERNCDNPLKIN